MLDVVAHELGHNFGLYHARSLDCGLSAVAPPCTYSEYGDSIDMMGRARGHYSAFMKERLGWLGVGTSPVMTTVQSSGSYMLEPFESPSAGGAKALKILKAVDPITGKRTWYFVEFRQPTGFDSFLAGYANIIAGVVVRTGSESSGNSSYLLDMTPETSSWNDPALAVGKTFADASAGLTLRTLSTSSGGAWVSVTLDGASCTRGNPTVSLAPSQSPWLSAGSMAAFTMTVANTDSAGCPASDFLPGSTVPSGWAASFGSPAIALNPGSAQSTPLYVTSAAGTANGFYSVVGSVTHGGDTLRSASGAATYVVMSSLTVDTSVDRASYSRNQTAQFTARVTSGATVVVGTSVVFTVTKAGGATVTKTSTTDVSGVATASLKLTAKDPPGSYVVTARVSHGGLSGTGTAAFVVTK